MPKKSRKSRSKRRHSVKTRKQKIINMVGCSKKHKHNEACNKDLGCPKCGPNCHCGPNCNCSHPCPGSCYLNRRKKLQKGGSGCGPCGCPVGGFTYKDINKFGGAYNYPKDFNDPVIIDGTNNGSGFVRIPGTSQRGGSCGSCGAGVQSGGNSFYKPAAPIPGPFVGSPWGAKVNELPGMNGISNDRNYLNSYSGTISNDPQTQMLPPDANAGYKTLSSMVGGKKKKRKSQTGGGLIPQDLINLGRNFSFNLQSAYNSLNGYQQPVNPMPYKDQLPRSLNNRLLI
jgi:hypothetical protein